MKIKIEIDENLTEDEIVIRCRSLNEDIFSIQKKMTDAVGSRQQMAVTKGETEFYLTLEDILFFETVGNAVAVHTADQIYQTRLRLYELEEILPGSFMRVSKSTIMNIGRIQSVHKNITGASEVEFVGSPKKVFVSRSYFKLFMSKLEEKRLSK